MADADEIVSGIDAVYDNTSRKKRLSLFCRDLSRVVSYSTYLTVLSTLEDEGHRITRRVYPPRGTLADSLLVQDNSSRFVSGYSGLSNYVEQIVDILECGDVDPSSVIFEAVCRCDPSRDWKPPRPEYIHRLKEAPPLQKPWHEFLERTEMAALLSLFYAEGDGSRADEVASRAPLTTAPSEIPAAVDDAKTTAFGNRANVWGDIAVDVVSTDRETNEFVLGNAAFWYGTEILWEQGRFEIAPAVLKSAERNWRRIGCESLSAYARAVLRLTQGIAHLWAQQYQEAVNILDGTFETFEELDLLSGHRAFHFTKAVDIRTKAAVRAYRNQELTADEVGELILNHKKRLADSSLQSASTDPEYWEKVSRFVDVACIEVTSAEEGPTHALQAAESEYRRLGREKEAMAVSSQL